ncbi:MAG: T9SS type A sorting domain-containing protein [Saprospiraceae bacterium]|nr:T9SS type A sorting domain-containing protein [Saprospiraceae bacterium]
MKTLQLFVLFTLSLNVTHAQLAYWEIESSAFANTEFSAIEVAVSGDFAFLAAHRYNSDAGAVACFQFTNEEWVETALLEPSDGAAGDRFGLGCAVDGEYLLIGAPTDNFTSNLSGKAYFYRLENGNWVEKQIIEPNLSGGAAFGFICDIEGDQAIIGAPDDSFGTGAAIIYKRNSDVWEEQIVLTPPPGYSGYNFGAGASISGDWAAVGSYLFNSGGGFTNSIFMYQLVDGVWTFKQAVEHTESPNIAITPSWNVAHSNENLLFGYRHTSDGINPIVGGATFYQNEGDTWGPVQTVTAPDLEENLFGRHVALEGDFAIQGYTDEPAASLDSAHQILIYQKTDPTSWTEIGRLRVKSASIANYQGLPMDISEEFAIVGDPDANTGFGRAYIMDLREFTISGVSGIQAFAECKLYPNPAAELLYISSDSRPIKEVVLFDNQGRVIRELYNLNTIRIEMAVSGLPAGLYYAQIAFENSGEVHPVVLGE